MSTHDYVIANASGSAVRSDINNVLAAIVSNNSSSSEPSTKYAYMLWADTQNNLIKIRNAANDGWITLFTTTGGLSISAASTFNEDVTFDGATAGRDMVWDRSDNALEFADNAKASFGTGSDLQIYHDATDSFIKSDTGVLKTLTDNFQVVNNAGDEILISAVANAGVELKYDNSKKFETYASGTTTTGHHIVHGNLALNGADNYKAKFGAADDLLIYHNATDNRFDSYGKTNDFINKDTDGSVSEYMVRMIPNSFTSLYYDGNNKLYTNADGVVIGGDVYPAANDNSSYTVGRSDLKWHEIYCGNATINTSDRNEKNTILESDLGLKFVNKLKPISFKWNKDDGKTHYGLIAQDIEELLATEGKTDKDFAALDIPAKGSMGLRYTELISPLIKAIQELSTEVQTLKTKVDAFEAN